MFRAIRRLAKHSVIYGIGHILSRSIGFLLLPIHTTYLSPEEYGVTTLLFSSMAILNVVFSYGLDVAFLRFFILAKSRREKEKVFSTAYWMLFSTGFLFSILVFLFPSFFGMLIFRTNQYEALIRLSAGILFADVLRLLPFLLLRGEEKSIQFVTLNTANIVLTLVLNILFVAVLKKGVYGVFVSNFLASGATLLLVFPIFQKWLRKQFSSQMLGELLRFGLPYVPSGLAVVIMDQISRFFIDRMMGKAATGIFSAGYKLGMFMALVVAAFRFAWHPFFLSTSKEKEAPQIFARILTYFLLLTGFLMVGFSLFVNEIVKIRLFGVWLFGKAYTNGLVIVPIVLLAYIFYGAYANFVVGIYLKKKTGWLPFVTGLGALVTILANWLLIPLFGISGAAWATCLGYGTMAIALYWVNQRLYPIPYEFGRMAKIVLILGMGYALGKESMALGYGWMRGVCLLALPLLFFLFRFFEKREMEILRTQIRRWYKKI